MIKVLADQNLYKLADFLPKEVEVSFFNPDESMPELSEFDAWLIRTVTEIHPKTIPEIPARLKFIGTGSSGNDHVDIDFLSRNGVHFVDAKGCNANAVAEYVTTALLLLQNKLPNLMELRVGIVGVGAVGTKTNQLLEKLGFETVLHDPPRENREAGFKSASMEEVLECDILTFHVPLTRSGLEKTHHWLDEEKLRDNTFDAIINTARGGVIDERAVLRSKSEGSINHLIIDVWENEPDFNSQFARECFIATPHIAGYSKQAKLNASRMICQDLCDFFSLHQVKIPTAVNRKAVTLNGNLSLISILKTLHPILEYDQKLRDLINDENKIQGFRTLRTSHPFRNEYLRITLNKELLDVHPELKKLGFKS